VLPHEVLSSQDRTTLLPDDLLMDEKLVFQPRLLDENAATCRVPLVDRRTIGQRLLQSDADEGGEEVARLVRVDVVVPVLVLDLGLVGPALGVIATPVVHQVRRIRGHESGALAVHEATHVLVDGGVSAEDPVRPEEPQVAGLGPGRRGLRHVVGVGQPSFWRTVQ
jgi:hypothetical protein